MFALALASCGPAPDPLAVSALPAAPDPPDPAEWAPGQPAASPGRFANRYVVIVATEASPEALRDAEAKIHREHPTVPLETLQLHSTEFSGLRPCWWISVANSFAGVGPGPRAAGRRPGRR